MNDMYYSHVGTCLGLVQIYSKSGHFYMWLCCWCQGMWGVIVSGVLWLVDHVWAKGVWEVFKHGTTFKWCFASCLASSPEH